MKGDDFEIVGVDDKIGDVADGTGGLHTKNGGADEARTGD